LKEKSISSFQELLHKGEDCFERHGVNAQPNEPLLKVSVWKNNFALQMVPNFWKMGFEKFVENVGVSSKINGFFLPVA
jgi:hypothetical protein